MLKILIVDDEYFTIQNICQRVQWKDLSITEVQTAEDGVFALDLAMQVRPDILLTDVRMPRMNGIVLSRKLRELYPDLCIIFMSGYSDKEYLKSAIDLQAYGYIEKPLQMDEVQATLQKTVRHLLSERNKQQTITKLSQSYDDAFPVLRSELARKLRKPGFQYDQLPSGMQSVLSTFDTSKACFTAVVMLTHTAAERIAGSGNGISNGNASASFSASVNGNANGNVSGNGNGNISVGVGGVGNSHDNLDNLLRTWKLTNEIQGVFYVKDSVQIIMHIFNVPEGGLAAYSNSLEALWRKLVTVSASPRGVQISVGTMGHGFESLSSSYDAAMKARHSFFFDSDLHLAFYEPSQGKVYPFKETLLEEFSHSLLTQEKEKAFVQIQHITLRLKTHQDTMIKAVKGFFYKMALQINIASEKFGLPVLSDTEDKDSIFETIQQFHTLWELETYLIDMTQRYFELLSIKNQKSDMGYTIKSFIEANFADPDLSLKKISEFCFLSEARLCVVFKEATGKTLNQYITEYRMQKAKDYLQFTDTKISEVAEKVGFTDGNYFAKTFRKTTGISPSKFRESWHHA